MVFIESLLDRVRGEYGEMPGLRLNLPQACRLWQVDTSTCETLLDRLVSEGFLSKSRDGYTASPSYRRADRTGE
jgi:hypothetical protein